MPNAQHIWRYRGHELKPLEWGLWKATDEPGRYLLCYRPQGRGGPCVRQWARTGGGITVGDLRQKVRSVRAEIEGRKLGIGLHVPAHRAADEYRTELTRLGRTLEHVRDIDNVLTRFLATSGIGGVQHITGSSIEQFLQSVAHGDDKHRPASPRTQNRSRGHVSAWLTWCVKRDYIDSNPAAAVDRVKQDQKFRPFPLPTEMTGLVDSAANDYDAGLWALFALTGLRRGSILRLALDSFRPEGIFVPQTKRRTEWFLAYDDGCPLWGPELTAIGRRLWGERVPSGEYIRSHFEATCEVFGKRFTPHALRHGFASWMMWIGEHDSDIAAWLHHTTPAMVQRTYAHLRPHGREHLAKNRESVRTMRSHLIKKALGHNA